MLYTASEPLVDGTDAVVDALMDMVEAQLEESDIQVELTADNYKEELDQLMAEGSSVDARLRDSLKDAKDTLRIWRISGKESSIIRMPWMRLRMAAGNCGTVCRNCRMKPMI